MFYESTFCSRRRFVIADVLSVDVLSFDVLYVNHCDRDEDVILLYHSVSLFKETVSRDF
jgi:hypothetical protein